MHHRITLSGCIFAVRHISTIGKNLLNSNISSISPHNMVNFGALTADIGWRFYRHPSKFQRVSRLGFLTAAMSLTGGQLNLHDVGPSPGLLRYICIFWGSCPLTEFYHMQNSPCVQVSHSPILAVLLHGTPAVGSAKLWGMVLGMEFRNLHRGRHLYSAGQPSCWALAHILVHLYFHSERQHCK